LQREPPQRTIPMLRGHRTTKRTHVNELQDLVLRRLAELGTPGRPMSMRQAVLKTRGAVSYETFRGIARGEHSGNIADKTAEALSRARDVPVQQIYDAARVPRPASRWVMPARFDRLDIPQRRLVEDVAAAILEAYEKGRRDGS
jgi:hypothetical protein